MSLTFRSAAQCNDRLPRSSLWWWLQLISDPSSSACLCGWVQTASFQPQSHSFSHYASLTITGEGLIVNGVFRWKLCLPPQLSVQRPVHINADVAPVHLPISWTRTWNMWISAVHSFHSVSYCVFVTVRARFKKYVWFKCERIIKKIRWKKRESRQDGPGVKSSWDITSCDVLSNNSRGRRGGRLMTDEWWNERMQGGQTDA